MSLNDKELMGVYACLQQVFREDLHLARPLIQWLQQQEDVEKARRLAMEMARRMLATGYASSAIAFLEICKRLECPQKDDIESMMSMAQMSLSDSQVATGKTFSLIDNLSDHEAMDFIRKASLVHYQVEKHVVHQDEVSDNFYLILKGEMDVYMQLEDGQNIHLSTLHPGDYFGEYACVYQLPRSASVKTSSDASLLEFSKESIAELMQQSPEAGEELMHIVGVRLISSMLQTHPAFESLAKADKDWLAEESMVLALDDGEVIDKNMQAQCHVMIYGCIEVIYRQENETITYQLTKDDMFGDACPVLQLPHHVLFAASDRCLVCCIPAHIFQSLMRSYGDFEYWVKQHGLARKQHMSSADTEI